MNALEATSTSALITKAWQAAGIFKKSVEEFSFERVKLIQYHHIDIEKAQKIRSFNEENRNRIKAFSEILIRQNPHDVERVFPNPKRLKVPQYSEKARIEFVRKTNLCIE
jgi:hypothetical protein